jgi:hypothetical protein
MVEVVAGEVLTERQALQALLLPSANNIAYILARWDAGGRAAFVARMNQAAAQLGMAQTRYTDPSGLDPTTVSTAADQVTLARAAMEVPALAQIVAMPQAMLPVVGLVKNVNALLGQDGSAQVGAEIGGGAFGRVGGRSGGAGRGRSGTGPRCRPPRSDREATGDGRHAAASGCGLARAWAARISGGQEPGAPDACTGIEDGMI